MGMQKVEAPCDVEGYAVPQAVPQQAAVCICLYGAVQVTACSQHHQHSCTQCNSDWQVVLLHRSKAGENAVLTCFNASLVCGVPRRHACRRTFHVLCDQQRVAGFSNAGAVKLYDVAVVVEPLQDPDLAIGSLALCPAIAFGGV